MNYELKGLSDSGYTLASQSRKIKLRQVSFANVFGKWKAVSAVPTNVEVPVQPTPVEENNFVAPVEPVVGVENTDSAVEAPVESVINKLPVGVSTLSGLIVLVDTNWGALPTLKRRVLAISQEMFNNINSNVNKSVAAPVDVPEEAPVVDGVDSIDEEEIKQAVKDAFDKIDFSTPAVDSIKTDTAVEENNQAVKDAFDQIDFTQPAEEDIVISPEEVNNTVVDTDDISFSYGDNNDTKDEEVSIDFDNTADESTDADINQTPDNSDIDNGLFSFEDINFDKIDTDTKDDVVSYSIDDNKAGEVSSVELDSLLSEVKELKAKKDEQDRKTASAEKLATEKEQEKEKAKADFIKYKSEIKEELDKSKKIEEENLERARKAEEFTTAISNIMNSNSDISVNF